VYAVGFYVHDTHVSDRAVTTRVVSERNINNNVVPVFSFSKVFLADANVFLDITVPAVSV